MQQHTVHVGALPRLTLDQSMLLAASSLPLFWRRLSTSLRPSVLSNCSAARVTSAEALRTAVLA